MNLEYFTIFLLILISAILSLLLIKSLRTKNTKEDLDIINIKEQLNSLLHKTMEQSGYMNSKIDEIGDLTKKMTSAMTANISDMGQMGEVILENILENCGMTKDRDYKTQFSGKMDEGNNLRPDVVIFLPENRNIIIDSKVPMKDWYQYQNSDEDKIKEKSIFNFISSIKNHINSIHKKDYKNLMNVNSPDYVFIFMPHDYAFVTAQKFDPISCFLCSTKTNYNCWSINSYYVHEIN